MILQQCCPMCGVSVRVVSDEREGTGHYEPVQVSRCANCAAMEARYVEQQEEMHRLETALRSTVPHLNARHLDLQHRFGEKEQHVIDAIAMVLKEARAVLGES